MLASTIGIATKLNADTNLPLSSGIKIVSEFKRLNGDRSTFRVSLRRRGMYSSHARLCACFACLSVCVSVCSSSHSHTTAPIQM